MPNTGHVLVPVDLTPRSLAAIGRMRAMSGELATIEVLHVVPPFERAPAGEYADPFSDDARVAHVERTVRTWLDASGLNEVPLHVRIGPPAPTIAHCARELDVDLIALAPRANHERFGYHDGSVTNEVVRIARCPVLVLHAEEQGSFAH